MFIAYNYSPESAFYNAHINGFLSLGNRIYESHKEEVQRCLSEFITEEGIIQGTALKQNWFSVEKADVFISHSHKDINKVKAFAGWLQELFGLTTFIDSCTWGYCDDLLNRIDKKYCYNSKTKTYNYSLRNYTTSHVHMMLSTALTETMDRSECVVFFNTPNSIVMKDELASIKKDSKITTSPWILYELTMVSEMRRTKPDRRSAFFEHNMSAKRDDFVIEYDVTRELKTLPCLKDDHLRYLLEHHSSSRHALDELYEVSLSKKGINGMSF